MMLAPTLAATRSRIRLGARALDAGILLVFLAAATALLLEGGGEALLGAAAGAFIGAQRDRGAFAERALGGAYAGLFAGALFAAFFHGAMAALLSQPF